MNSLFQYKGLAFESTVDDYLSRLARYKIRSCLRFLQFRNRAIEDINYVIS